jgi:hypothetical protein
MYTSVYLLVAGLARGGDPGYCHRYNFIVDSQMLFTQICWDLDDDPHGNVQHIADHDVPKEEVEEVLGHPEGIERSRSSGLLIAFGETTTGRLLAVVYEKIDDLCVYPVTAYEVE